MTRAPHPQSPEARGAQLLRQLQALPPQPVATWDTVLGWRRQDFSASSLASADLSSVDLSGAELRWPDLREADLRGANMVCMLELATLDGARCDDQTRWPEWLTPATLQSALLGNATL